MKKRLFYLTLTFILLFSMTACVSSPESKRKKAEQESITFEETTYVDNDDLIFKITSIDVANIWGYTLNAYCENKSDKTLMFSLRDVTVNGYLVTPLWAEQVTPGSKSNTNISFSNSDFEAASISEVTVIEFTLHVYNSDSITDDVYDERFVLYPKGEEAANIQIRETIDSDIVVFDNEDCSFIITATDPDGFMGFTLNTYIYNKTDKHIMIGIKDCSVNGYMIDPFWATDIIGNAQEFTNIYWLKTYFENNGITSVDNITMTIHIYDYDSIFDDILEETYSIDF